MRREAFRGPKDEYLGESKIERGLSEFRIYRTVEQNKDLLRVRDSKNYRSDSPLMSEHLRNSLHFTTQKNMALEYRMGGKPVLLEQRGKDFLKDIQMLQDQGLRILLLSHDDLASLQRIKLGQFSEEDVQGYLKHRTYEPKDVSLRLLRKAAEIVVLLPDSMSTLPLRQSTIKKTRVKSLLGESRYDQNISGPGGFHSKISEVNKRPDKHLQMLHRRRKKMELLRSELIGDLHKKIRNSSGAVDNSEQERISRQLKEIDREITDVEKQIRDQRQMYE